MYIADLHIHSRYSRATSRDCTPEHLDLWARRKGIHIVGTGDFTHPAWREELSEKLEPAEDGLYTLKKEYRIDDGIVPGECTPRFVITGEISSIYKKNGKVRKVHSLILLPGLEDAQRISTKLEQIGNIHSDGRPILGLDCHDLLEIILELCPKAVYVPAHIWTPHFSLFGAFSGFDTVEECFEDLTPYIHAMETGLSSDPPMNWRVSALDRYQLISNSDAHSPAKLGREANLFDIPLSYAGIADAIQKGEGLHGTIEFFPEEGKYHMDGHRKCNLCLTPSQTLSYNGKCPVCGRKITIGVSHRVEELADRPEGFIRENARAFESLVPLPEVVAASTGHSAASVKTQREYQRMLENLGPEFEILRTLPIEDIRRISGSRIAEGIARLRQGKVERIPGFDGEYGVISLFSAEEINNTEGQMDFFSLLGVADSTDKQKEDRGGVLQKKQQDDERQGMLQKKQLDDEQRGMLQEKTPETERQADECGGGSENQTAAGGDTAAGGTLYGLNAEQENAVRCIFPHVAVIAGPGTGKTKTLVSRISYLLDYRKVKASEITAVTFTNQAAEEMRRRIGRKAGKNPGGRQSSRTAQIGTFHSICLNFLKEQGDEFMLMGEAEQRSLAERTVIETGIRLSAGKFLEEVSRRKSGKPDRIAGETGQEAEDGRVQEEEDFRRAYAYYEAEKTERGLLDFDDLLLCTAEKIRNGDVKEGWEKRFRYLLVDEFQDINPAQLELVRLWAEAGQELFVIGDPDQSIYGFRGADAECFENLKKLYSDLEVISLKENYRSSPQILCAAEAVISQAEVRTSRAEAGASHADHTAGEQGNAAAPQEKTAAARTALHPNRPNGVPVRLVKATSPMGEAIFIAKEINRMAGGIGMLEAHSEAWEHDGGKIRGFDEIAVLCRTHRQAEMVEKCLKQESIPCVVAGREEFLSDSSVQDSIWFFRFLEHPAGDVMELKECAENLWHIQWNEIVEDAVKGAVKRFLPLYRKKKPGEFLEEWMDFLCLKDDPSMKKLQEMTVFYQTMPEFLNALELGVESDLKRCGGKGYTSGAVTVMTLHGSKGLEFPAVFIYGAEQGSIPLESEKHPADIAEERRLFYVGLTRAEEELILTASGETSEFLKNVPDDMFVPESEERGRKRDEYQQMSLFDLPV